MSGTEDTLSLSRESLAHQDTAETPDDVSFLRRAARIAPLDDAAATAPGDPAASARVHTIAPGASLGRYAIARKLGQGGMGAVYEARAQPGDETMGDELVALKTLLRASPDDILRFKREFRGLRSIHHRNLVRLGELAVHEGIWFFTMEYVDGMDLVRALGRADTRSYHDRVRTLFDQTVRGLAAVHRAGKLHCDIKPMNVMVDRTGRVVILDFGLLSDLPSDIRSSLTAESLAGDAPMAGTPAYMAPEQICGDALTPATDFYSLGVMLYEAITGRLPLVGTVAQVLQGKLTWQPCDPRDEVPDCPKDLSELCVRLLAREPEERPDAERILAYLDAPPTHDTSAPDIGIAPVSDPFGAGPFVGRGRELENLLLAHERVQEHARPLAVFVHGESGVGKSSLVRHFARSELPARARGAAGEPGSPDRAGPPVVLAGRCYEREWMPYKAIDGVIDSLVRFWQRLAPRHAAALTPRNAALLARMFPVLRKIPTMAEAPARTTVDDQERRRQAFAALRQLFHLICERHPLVVIIDDIQWTDVESLELLREVLRPPDAPALLLVMTRRSGTPLSVTLPCATETMELESLDPDAARELATWLLCRHADDGRADGEMTPEYLAREGSGHPLYMRELADHLQRDGTETTDIATGIGTGESERSMAAPKLDAAIWARVSRLERDARTLLGLVALAMAPMSRDVLARASGLPAKDISRLLDLLAVERLVRGGRLSMTDTDVDASRVQPYHDRVRESVVAHLSGGQRREHHAALAGALRQEATATPMLLLHHLRGAGAKPEASVEASRAAREANESLAYERAAEYHALALDFDPERTDADHVRLALAEALARAGLRNEAAEQYEILAERSVSEDAFDYRIKRIGCLLSNWDIHRGREALRQALDTAGGHYPTAQARLIAEYLWGMLRLTWSRWPVDTRALEHMDPGKRALLDLYAVAFQGTFSYEPLRAAFFLMRGLIMARRLGHARHLAQLSVLAIFLGLASGKPMEHRLMRGLRAQVEQFLKDHDDPEIEGFYRLVNGPNLLVVPPGWSAERVDQHFADIEALMARSGEVTFSLGIMRLFWGGMLIRAGAFADARQRAAEFVADARRRRDSFNELTYLGGFPTENLLEDRPEAGRDDVRGAHEKRMAMGVEGLEVNTWITLATIDLYQGAAMDHGEIERGMVRSRRTFLRLAWWRPQIFWIEGRTALLRAQQDRAPGALRAALRLAKKRARALEREGTGEADLYAALLCARIAYLEGRHADATSVLERAIELADENHLMAHAAGARMRLGQMLRDAHGRDRERGEALIRQATDWMQGQGARNPARLANLAMDSLDDETRLDRAR